MHAENQAALLDILRARFDRNMRRHSAVTWADVLAKLDGNATALRALREMEDTGGEPDVVRLDGDAAEFTFCDCAVESPLGRRSCCYDQEALDARKENKPANIRALGGALFCDRRYDSVFVYHNGASSYYAARGFRGVLRI